MTCTPAYGPTIRFCRLSSKENRLLLVTFVLFGGGLGIADNAPTKENR
jgi:hypothetical protein